MRAAVVVLCACLIATAAAVPGPARAGAAPVGLIKEIPLHGNAGDVAAGPDGNLWFNHTAILTPSGQAIGRITPSGEIAEFFAGLPESAHVANLTAGPGGVWFADESTTPAVGVITPSGAITEFPGLQRQEFPIFYGPTPGPEGNLWFGANDQVPPTVDRITPAGAIERFSAGIHPRAEFVGPFAVGADGNVWFRVIKSPPRAHPHTKAGLTAIGRITPAGQIAEFSRCLRPMPEFSGPNFLTRGPDGNVWFTTWQSGNPADARPSSTPSVGRVTPSGEITEFRLGLHPRSQPEELVSSGGRLWFIDRETEAIGTIIPPRKPPNTFLVFPSRRQPGRMGARLRVALPGPGRLTVSGRGIRTTSTRSAGCGTVDVAVRPDRGLRRLLSDRGSQRVTVRITFAPRGGSPFSQKTIAVLYRR